MVEQRSRVWPMVGRLWLTGTAWCKTGKTESPAVESGVVVRTDSFCGDVRLPDGPTGRAECLVALDSEPQPEMDTRRSEERTHAIQRETSTPFGFYLSVVDTAPRWYGRPADSPDLTRNRCSEGPTRPLWAWLRKITSARAGPACNASCPPPQIQNRHLGAVNPNFQNAVNLSLEQRGESHGPKYSRGSSYTSAPLKKI